MIQDHLRLSFDQHDSSPDDCAIKLHLMMKDQLDQILLVDEQLTAIQFGTVDIYRCVFTYHDNDHVSC